jgi:hypothetical protein
MSARELADATAALGYPITRSQIANYESERKQGLDVAELLVIAAALDVAPLRLLFPDKPNRPVEELPNQPVPTSDAISRFTGNWDWVDDLRDDVHGAVELLTQVLGPAGIPPAEQSGASAITQRKQHDEQTAATAADPQD